MEIRLESLGTYAKRVAAYSIICAGVIGIFDYASQKYSALEDAINKSNEITIRLESDYQKLSESIGRNYSDSKANNALIKNLQGQVSGLKSELEAKVNETNEELTKSSKEGYDRLAAKQQKALDYNSFHFTYEQKIYFKGNRSNVLKTSQIEAYDHQVITDPKEYMTMTDDQIKKRRQEYAEKNAIVEIPPIKIPANFNMGSIGGLRLIH